MIGESKGDQNTSSVDIPSGITGTKRRWKWNILSADFMEGFETVDMNTWTVEHREQLFENQVIDSAPDIICLQEVKSSGDFFCIQSICKRLSEHWQLAGYVPKKHKRDGVAIFYRPQKIRLLSTVAIPLYVEESESQVACLATFEHRDNREIRLRQVDALLNALSLWNIDNEKAVVILCGDLNAEPYEATITKLQSFGFQWIYQQMQIDDPILYSSNKKRQGEEYQIRMQDYIFIKSSSQFSIDCESCLLPPLIHAELNALWIPNQEYPSDHWDIVTDLSVTPK
ncbi:Nocturnin [Galdieria sulphuraria]|nr:Nocturnin [Galdieria sulphuraria]